MELEIHKKQRERGKLYVSVRFVIASFRSHTNPVKYRNIVAISFIKIAINFKLAWLFFVFPFFCHSVKIHLLDGEIPIFLSCLPFIIYTLCSHGIKKYATLRASPLQHIQFSTTEMNDDNDCLDRKCCSEIYLPF